VGTTGLLEVVEKVFGFLKRDIAKRGRILNTKVHKKNQKGGSLLLMECEEINNRTGHIHLNHYCYYNTTTDITTITTTATTTTTTIATITTTITTTITWKD